MVADVDYVEIGILLLPLITVVLLGIWDYITTVYGVMYGGGYEINPVARELLEDGRLDALMWWKGFHILLNVIVYVVGLTLYELGKVRERNIAKYAGMWFMILFFISYFVGLIAVTNNVLSITKQIIYCK